MTVFLFTFRFCFSIVIIFISLDCHVLCFFKCLHNELMATSLTAVGTVWASLSLIAAILCCSGFYLPFWIQVKYIPLFNNSIRSMTFVSRRHVVFFFQLLFSIKKFFLSNRFVSV